MPDPSITVLMTVFNAGCFFEASLRSIVSQTFRDFEFLIVDDASTDGSAETAEIWAQGDSRIRVIRNERNKGQTPCLNQGLQMARGRWIARQDADDLSHPLRLARQFERVTVQPELVLLGTCGRIIDENDRLIGLLDAPPDQQSITWTAPFLNPFMHTSVMFRAETVRGEFGGYDESFRIAQDYDLWTRVIEKHPAANVAERLVAYRHLGTSLSKAGRELAFSEARQVSGREFRRVFGRNLSSDEQDVVASFREGLSSDHQEAFWNLYESLRAKYPADVSRTAALHHLKAAGALPPLDAFAELASALRCSALQTIRWLKDRYFR